MGRKVMQIALSVVMHFGVFHQVVAIESYPSKP